MVLKGVLAGLLATGCATAGAQVFRCPDPTTGHITYSDVACPGGREVVRERTPEERQQDAERAEQARRRVPPANEREAARPPSDNTVSQAPTPAASPPAIDPYRCRQAQRELSIASNLRTGSPADKRRRMNAAIVEVNAECGTHTELIQEPIRVQTHPPHDPINCNGSGDDSPCD